MLYKTRVGGRGGDEILCLVHVYFRSIAFGESLWQIGEFKALGHGYKGTRTR